MREYGAKTYLKDLNSSVKQYRQAPLAFDSNDKNKILLDIEDFDEKGNFHGIFEGVSVGELKLALCVDFNNGKDVVVLDEAYITIKNIKDMYKLINIRNGPTSTSADSIPRYRDKQESGNVFAPDTTRIFVWVHGYNNTLKGSIGSADVVYKRLYQTGFRGSFFAISWDTANWIQPFSAADFNGDWENSFRSATITADIIKELRKNSPNSRIDIGAHSLGNNLVLYSLRLLSAEGKKPIDNFIMAESAVPGEVFCGITRTSDYDLLNYRFNFFDNMYAKSLNAVTGKIYNTYSSNDDILDGVLKINNFWLGLPTPLDDRYNLVIESTNTKSNSSIDPLGLTETISSYAKLHSEPMYNSNTIRPYGIKGHCSLSEEYYYDVKEFYNYLLYQRKK